MNFALADEWNRTKMPFKKLDYGKWELKIDANPDGTCPLKHNSEVKLIVKSQSGELLERLSPWATYVTQNRAEGTTFKQRIWHPKPENVRVLTFEI